MQTEDVIMRKQRVLVEKEGNVSLKIENYNLKLLEQKNVNQVKKIAYHEVAHLVVAEKCNGYYIDELYGLTIVPIKQERGTLFGSAMFTMKKSVKNENIIQYIKSGIDYIAISLAGNIAERIGFPNEIAHESILDCEYAKEKAESIISKMKRSGILINELNENLIIGPAKDNATDIICENWIIIKRIAEKLYKEKVLLKEDIEELL